MDLFESFRLGRMHLTVLWTWRSQLKQSSSQKRAASRRPRWPSALLRCDLSLLFKFLKNVQCELLGFFFSLSLSLFFDCVVVLFVSPPFRMLTSLLSRAWQSSQPDPLSSSTRWQKCFFTPPLRGSLLWNKPKSWHSKLFFLLTHRSVSENF